MAADQGAVLLVFASLPDAAAARGLARRLVEERLAACVSMLAPCSSVYRWQGQVEESAEVPVLIKTTAARYADLEAAIRAAHPYELPEIVAVPVQHGLPAYLAWVAAETAPSVQPSP
jgi:periplasmic divalent cation tolerance protein